jgi:rubrerythrin
MANEWVLDALKAGMKSELDGIGAYEAAAVHPALRSLFAKVADWEERHYRDLLRVQEESERFYWDAARWVPS